MAALITLGIIGIIIIVAAGAVLYVVNRIKNVLNPIIEITGNPEIEQFIEEVGPKSVNAMTSIYLPRIEKDFPEFNYFEFKIKAENMIKSALSAIENSDIERLQNASKDLTEQVNARILNNKLNHQRESFRNIEIHRTEIKNYRNNAGTCIITLQSSVGYTYFATNEYGEVIKGDSEHTTQTRYDTELLYIQDIMQINQDETLLSNNCPNCGAPIIGLGNKVCPYCGSGIKEINIKVWSINKLTEC